MVKGLSQMSTRDELVARFKAFLDKNYPCCGVPGCCGEEEEATYLADIAYEHFRKAQEAAWDEGDEHGANFPHRKRGFKYDDNPYRSEQ
jgi:hypothetical protein